MKRPVWTQPKRDQVKRIFLDWLGRLYVTPLNINWDWREEPSPDDDDTDSVLFEVSVGFPYRNITLTCYPEAAKENEEGMSMHLLHEAMHCVLAPVDCSRYEPHRQYTTFKEFVTDNLTHYIWQLAKKCWALEDEIERLRKEVRRPTHRRQQGHGEHFHTARAGRQK